MAVYPSPRQQRHPRDPSNAAILDAVDAVRAQLTAMETRLTAMDARQNALPDLFMPRRELGAELGAIKERQGDHHARLTAIEEWRLAETQRAAQVQLTTQSQMATAQITTQAQVASGRTEQDNRLINLLWGALSGGGMVVLGFILAHLIH